MQIASIPSLRGMQKVRQRCQSSHQYYDSHLRRYRSATLILGVALVSAGLAGCGQKGPLFQSRQSAPVVSTSTSTTDDAGADAARKETVERDDKSRANDSESN
jgi:predicted small lipoprotein YifL